MSSCCWRCLRLALFVWALCLLQAASASQAEVSVGLERVAADVAFDRPVWAGPLPSEEGSYVVAEQRGRVLIIRPDVGDAPSGVLVMLDLVATLPDYSDRGRDQLGLLGLAFHPEFEKNREVYLHYTAIGPRRNVVSRWAVGEGGQIDPDSEEVLVEQRQPYATNNGGAIAFGPDGLLYIGIGDGGANGDPRNYAQRLDTFLGKVLRIDVDQVDEGRGLPYAIPEDNPFTEGAEVRPEVYAYGLSNPWRMSFDRKTGGLWLGDVGENDWEEINRVQKGGNYGWRWREGTHSFRKLGPGERLPNDLIDPVYEYPHTKGKAVVGGYVYCGKAIPELIGQYVYADYESGKVWALQLDAQGGVRANSLLLTVSHPSSFGEDAGGELLICSFGEDRQKPGDDAVYRIVINREPE